MPAPKRRLGEVEKSNRKAPILGNFAKSDRLPAPFGSREWELNNLKSDPGEVTNLATEHPDKLNELKVKYEAYVKENDVFDHNGYFYALYKKAYGVE